MALYQDTNFLRNLTKALFQLFGLTPGKPFAFDQNGKLVDAVVAGAAIGSYDKTTVGGQTLLAAAAVDRIVQILVIVNETFAQATGTKSSFDLGETGAAHKFKQTLNAGTAGDRLSYMGTLSAGKALLVTGTASTGDGTGGIDVSVQAAPLG